MRRNAFTLVELLVVIAIISILAALLLPSLKHAKQRAMVVACCSNMKQTLVGIEVYRADNNSTYPAVQEAPIDTAAKAYNAYYNARNAAGVEWVAKLAPNGLLNAGFRCTATLPEPSKATSTGNNLGSAPMWIFSGRHNPTDPVANAAPNKNRGWFLYFGPVPTFNAFGYVFDDANAIGNCYDPWASSCWGVPVFSNNPGIGNTVGNNELGRDNQVMRPLLGCPNIVFFSAPGDPNYIDTREPHMEQPFNNVYANQTTGFQVESRNWGYTDGHVQFYNTR